MQRETGLWQDVSELPSSLAATLDARDGVDDVAAVVGSDRVRRVVASGNGAAYYVAVALWLASLESSEGPEVVAVPSGLLARGAFAWREGDLFLAVSSSGEFRDLVEAVDAGVPTPFAAVTADAGSTLGSRADARALVTVEHAERACGRAFRVQVQELRRLQDQLGNGFEARRHGRRGGQRGPAVGQPRAFICLERAPKGALGERFVK